MSLTLFLVSPAASPRIPHVYTWQSATLCTSVSIQVPGERSTIQCLNWRFKAINTYGKIFCRFWSQSVQTTSYEWRNCHLNYWWWLSHLNIVFPISFITFCFRMAGRRKRRTSQMAWHITEFHGVAFLQVLLSKSNLFSITETKYTLLTDFLHFTAHEDDWTSL